MSTLSLICTAYAFIATGFCLGFVTCSVLSRNPIGEQQQERPEFTEGRMRTNVKRPASSGRVPQRPPPPPPPRDVRGRR